MTNTQKNQDNRKQQNDPSERNKDGGGRFEKGSDRAREAGRKGGRSS